MTSTRSISGNRRMSAAERGAFGFGTRRVGRSSRR